MQTTLAHSFTDVDGQEVTLTFKQTLLGAIRYTVMRQRFTDDTMIDAGARRDFILIVSWLIDVQGIDWRPPDETGSLDAFTANYHAFMLLFEDVEAFHEVVWAVNEWQGIHKPPEEVPEEVLTDAERADPNS
jgi:hypothetical protein